MFILLCIGAMGKWIRLTYQGGPPKTGIMYKTLCIYSYMFKLQSPTKYSPFDVIHLLRCFFHCSKQFLNSSILMPFSASDIFCLFVSPLPHWQTVSLCGLTSLGKRVSQDMMVWTGWVGHEGHIVLVKNCWTLRVVWESMLIYHPSWNGQIHWVFKKNSLKPSSASHNNTS